MEKEKNLLKNEPRGEEQPFSEDETVVIPVIKEFLNVEKKVVETGKIHIKKSIINKEQDINIPLHSDNYQVERITVKDKIFDEPPQIRNEGNKTIIPVVKEIVEVKKRYEVTEEIHIIKSETVIPHSEKVTLKKEKVSLERERRK
ncbi:MAG TPA: DUF2382 domain-containing protein [Hanamia sp.]|nr:DUF2382 domain-containing protein [Hanamia sp.]